MTTTFRRGFASSLLGTLALLLAGCGGGGSGISTPTATPIPGATSTPTPTPNSAITGNQLVFVSNRNSTTGVGDLYKSDLSGNSVVRLTSLATLSGGVEKPSVSPDGRSIVFQFGDSNASGGSNNIEIASIGTDGKNFKRLTNDGTGTGLPDDSNPVYSSNGNSIYFTSTRPGVDANGLTTNNVPHIWSIDTMGSTNSLIQVIKEPSAYPSLDTKNNLAYVATTRTDTPVAIYNLASSVTARIGTTLVFGQGAFGLALSPDGTRVAYSVGMTGSGASSSSVQILVFSVGGTINGSRDGGSPSSGASNRVGNWGRDSSTLFFDSANGANSRRQIFSATTPYSSPTKIPVGDTGDNFSPAFLPGSG